MTAGSFRYSTVDVIHRVLGEVAIFGDDDRHCLADEPHSVGCQRPLVHRLTQHDDEWIGVRFDIATGQHRDHAGPRCGLRGVDGQNFGMGVGRTQDGGVQGPRSDRQVICVIAAAGQQCGILDPLDRTAEPTLFRCRFRRWRGGRDHRDCNV